MKNLSLEMDSHHFPEYNASQFDTKSKAFESQDAGRLINTAFPNRSVRQKLPKSLNQFHRSSHQVQRQVMKRYKSLGQVEVEHNQNLLQNLVEYLHFHHQCC